MKLLLARALGALVLLSTLSLGTAAAEDGKNDAKPAEDAAGAGRPDPPLVVVDGVPIRAADLQAELRNQTLPDLFPYLLDPQSEQQPAVPKSRVRGHTIGQQVLVNPPDPAQDRIKEPSTVAVLDHYAAGKHSASILPGYPWMRRLPPSAPPSHDVVDSKQAEQELARQKRRALGKLIDEQLLLNEFHRLQDLVKRESADQDIDDITRESFNEDNAAMQAALAASGVTLEELRAMRERLIILSIMRTRLAGEVRITDATQVKAYYEKNPQRWRGPEMVKLHSLTLLKTDAKSGVQMEALRKRIAKGADFAETARAESQDSHAEAGGAWDWTDTADLSEGVRAAIAKLKPGALSGIIDQDGALILLRVDERRSPAPPPFEQVKDEVTQVMEEEERQKHLELKLKRLREAADIRMMDAGPV